MIKNLKSPTENKEIFHMGKKEAFTYIKEELKRMAEKLNMLEQQMREDS